MLPVYLVDFAHFWGPSTNQKDGFTGINPISMYFTYLLEPDSTINVGVWVVARGKPLILFPIGDITIPFTKKIVLTSRIYRLFMTAYVWSLGG